MAFAGLIFIGLLFGVILSASVVAFIVVRSGGPLKESLFGDGSRQPAFVSAPAAPDTGVEAERRQKLIEELRIAHKLLDQDKIEREQSAAAIKASAAEMTVIRSQLADRELRIEALQAALCEAGTRLDDVRSQLGEKSEELAKVSLQLKDARMELDVKESGSTVTSSQIMQLQRERDELAALVDQLRPRRPAVQPFA